MTQQTVYIKAEQCSVVTNKKVFLEDVVTIYGSDKKLVKELYVSFWLDYSSNLYMNEII